MTSLGFLIVEVFNDVELRLLLAKVDDFKT
jgi:hypothetical protein